MIFQAHVDSVKLGCLRSLGCLKNLRTVNLVSVNYLGTRKYEIICWYLLIRTAGDESAGSAVAQQLRLEGGTPHHSHDLLL